MPDRAQSTHSGDLVTEEPELTLDELCSACGLSREQIEIYAAEGIIEPQGPGKMEWRFSLISVIELRRARRLERDLGLNVAGVALALDLMEQIEMLKRRLARFERTMENSKTDT